MGNRSLCLSFVLSLSVLSIGFCTAQTDTSYQPTVIAYYSGGPGGADQYPVEKLTHIIYSFCHLKGNKLDVDDAKDSATIRSLVDLKKRNPKLKVLLSLGGWGGCRSCSEVFNSEPNRRAFASSVKHLNQYFQTDGIDLDWEYPTIEGHPGHPYAPYDRDNFTSLIRQLRKTLGKKYEISFAAGGFTKFLEESVDWKKIMPILDRVNIMSYDLVNGYDTITGHHTPLYSTNTQVQSTDNAVKYLLSLEIPANKLVIGAAFYARVWENVETANNGLHQVGKFKSSVPYKRLDTTLSLDKGYQEFWDSQAQAPYRFNAAEKLFATFDNKRSIEAKTKYTIDKRLNGIMFWELSLDMYSKGLLDTIIETIENKAEKEKMEQ